MSRRHHLIIKARKKLSLLKLLRVTGYKKDDEAKKAMMSQKRLKSNKYAIIASKLHATVFL